MARYTDVAWMDDRSAPSRHVRHNAEGLSSIFPPAYLLSFVIDDASEQLHHARDLTLQLRSRMQGVFGVSAAASQFTSHESAVITREIALYKTFRDKLAGASAALLTTQAGAGSEREWDALQLLDASGLDAVISAYESDGAASRVNVKPRGLVPTSTYDVYSVDAGRLGTATGEELMAKGIDLLRSAVSAAHIVLLREHRSSPNGRP